MRIIIKPFGAVALIGAIGTLGVLAFHNSRKSPDGSISGTSTSTASMAAAAVIKTPNLPTGTSASGTPAQALPPVRGHAIYRDGLENGWQAQGWTWAKEVSYDDPGHAHSGKTAIKVRFQEFDGLKFHHDPLDTHSFDRITFWAYGGDAGGQKIQLGGNCSEKENTGTGVMLDPLPAGKWVSVTVPLNRLGLRGKSDMTSFWIQGASNKPQAPLWVDEVRLLLPSESVPTGSALGIASDAAMTSAAR